MTSTPAHAPTAHAPEAPAAAPAAGTHNPDPLSKLVETGFSGGWKVLKKIMGYTRGLVEGTFAATGALAGIDTRNGPGVIERVEHTRGYVEKAVGKVIGFTAGIPLRIIEHPLKAGRILWNALLGRPAAGGGGHAAASHAEPAHAH